MLKLCICYQCKRHKSVDKATGARIRGRYVHQQKFAKHETEDRLHRLRNIQDDGDGRNDKSNMEGAIMGAALAPDHIEDEDYNLLFAGPEGRQDVNEQVGEEMAEDDSVEVKADIGMHLSSV
jgi:hypothetical protein